MSDTENVIFLSYCDTYCQEKEKTQGQSVNFKEIT